MEFKKWLDAQLKKDIPEDVIAINFNLYEEDEENVFAAQLVGCPGYDPDDDEWACDELFSSEEDLFYFEADGWEAAEELFGEILREYVDNNPDKLADFEYIAYGFVDGDLIALE